MNLKDLPPGNHIPDDFNVIIEIPAQAGMIKYEMDKDSGLLAVDRFMPTAMYYPANYGFIPNTLSGDGDPVDVLVITPVPVQAGSLIRARAVGVLNMEDESGVDKKVLALPIKKICAQLAHIQKLEDVPEILRKSIVHFFEQYKALEAGKWVKITGWEEVQGAQQEINDSIQRYQDKYK
jgi:inorganic pyrophosphatase